MFYYYRLDTFLSFFFGKIIRPKKRLMTFDKGLCLEITSGPACLPVGFDFNIISTLGTGLELVKALLPNKGAQLTYEQRGDEVSVVYCFENDDGT